MKEVHIIISLFGSIYDGSWDEINSVWYDYHKALERTEIIDKEMKYLSSLPEPDYEDSKRDDWHRANDYKNSYVTTRTILE